MGAAARRGPVAAGISRDFEFAARWMQLSPGSIAAPGDTDIYFVANRTDRAQDIQARFRVEGKEAELWHPDTGAIEPASYAIADDRTTVPLHLDQRESVFVVFRHGQWRRRGRFPR